MQHPPGRCRQGEGRSRGPRLRVGIPLCLPPSLRVPLSAVLSVVITSCPGSGGTCAHDNYACAACARWPQGCQVRTAALRGAVDRGAASCPGRMSIVDLVIVSAVGLATPGPPTRWPPRCASPALASDVHGRGRWAYPPLDPTCCRVPFPARLRGTPCLFGRDYKSVIRVMS